MFLRILYYMEKNPARGEFHPGMKFSSRLSLAGIGFSARAES